MAKLKQVFSDPRRVENIAPLKLPTLPKTGTQGMLAEVRGILAEGRNVFFEAGHKVAGHISVCGGLRDFMKDIPTYDRKPAAKHSISLSDNLSLNPQLIPFKSGVLGFDLSFRDAVAGRVSFDLLYDYNPYFKGAEIYRAVTPRLQGQGLSTRFGDFGEAFLRELGFGYVVSFPGHPATCADVAKRGWMPLPGNLQRSKVLFGSNGVLSFEVDKGKKDEVGAILRAAEGIPESQTDRRRNFYTDRFARALFAETRENGRRGFRSKYYFMRKLSEPPIVHGLDAVVLGGITLNWEQYQEALASKVRRRSGVEGNQPHQGFRDHLRERLLRGKL